MLRSIEQRCAIKFCVKLNKSASETFAMLQNAYGEDSLSKAQTFKWHKAFRDGREDFDDEQRAGRPSSSRTVENLYKVKALLDSDDTLSNRAIAKRLGISYSSVQQMISEDLQMRRKHSSK